MLWMYAKKPATKVVAISSASDIKLWCIRNTFNSPRTSRMALYKSRRHKGPKCYAVYAQPSGCTRGQSYGDADRPRPDTKESTCDYGLRNFLEASVHAYW